MENHSAGDPSTLLPVAAEARQEFPRRMPAALGVETTALESLVHHAHAVDASLPLERVHRQFREHQVDFMAVVRAGAVIGLCARGQVGFLLGSRFGFALNGARPVETALAPQPLIFPCTSPLRHILDCALARHGDEFHEDVLLIDAAGGLLGLIPIETLAQLQTQLVAEQLAALRHQHETLSVQNLQLFEANHALRQSQGLYLGLFESHVLGLALLDPRGVVSTHNQRFAELLCANGDDCTALALASRMTENERREFVALLESYAKGRALGSTRELALAVPGRGTRLFRCFLGWIKETGQIHLSLDDITEQRAMERRMLRQEKQTLLDTLVGGIAHELNNKLTPVHGFAELLGDTADPDARRFTRIITTCVTEAALIIRQLLQLSKPGAGEPQVIDLRLVVEESLIMLKFPLRECGCQVRKSLPSDSVWVLADAAQLKQVIMNLVLNALHALAGRSDAALALEVQDQDGRALLAVADNGVGISAENLGRIFDPFFTTKGPDRGTGLGLSISLSIVRQLGGEIAVESQPGAGARFTVSLPRASMIETSSLFQDHEAAPAKQALRPTSARVLVVEDEVVVRQLLQELLRANFGCSVELAAHGAEALVALEQSSFDLILSDIRMPVMSGPELYRRLCEVHPEMARRFVFITGYSGETALEHQIEDWGVPVVAKPFTGARLAEACEPFLQVAHARHLARSQKPETRLAS